MQMQAMHWGSKGILEGPSRTERPTTMRCASLMNTGWKMALSAMLRLPVKAEGKCVTISPCR